MEEYREIDLRQILTVLNKGKKQIAVVFLTFFLLLILYVKYIPAGYLVTSSFEIGQSEDKILENSSQLSAKINKGVYGKYPGLKAAPMEKTNIIDLAISTKENPEEAKSFLNSLDEAVFKSHQEILDAKNRKMEKTIQALKNEADYLLSKNQQVATIRIQLINLQARIEEADSFPTRVVSEPEITEKHRRTALILSAGGLLALFLGLVSVFITNRIKKKA